MNSIKDIHTIFIAICLLFISCSGNNEQSLTNSSDSLEVQSPHNNISPAKNIDSIKNDNNKDLPLLVIENCGALWSKTCIPNEFENSKEIVEEAYKFFGSDSLVSIGSNGVLQQEIIEAYCMRGECGENQIALRLSNNECAGVLSSKKLLSDNSNFVFMRAVRLKDFNNSEISLDDSLIINSGLYSDSVQSILIQIGGKGYIQENDWPMYNEIIWRIIQVVDGKYLVYQWSSIKLSSTNLPKPIALSSKENDMTIIWYHGEGICCPSYSKAWITQVSLLENERSVAINGKFYKGGFGQPCD